MKQLFRRIVVAACAILMTASTAMAGQVNLSVAASLREAMNEMTRMYAKKHPGTTFVNNFGASGTLAQQIENGAPSDVFVTANSEWVDYLKGRKLLNVPSLKIFAYNELVFAGTTGRGVAGMRDLPKLDRIAIGSPRSVPAGRYATEAMQKSGVQPRLAGKLIMAKDVRECLMYAEMGEVDGAFVYRTDALIAKKARILFTVPGNLHQRVSYPMALTATGARNAEARAFFAWMQGTEAKSVLRKYGFLLK